MKYDLDKIRRNYYDSGVENAKIGNNLILNFKQQIFRAVNLYLIFTATLFFFLVSKLNNVVLCLPIKGWIGIGIVGGSLSLIVGLFALKEEHKMVVLARNKFLKKSKDILDYIKEYKITEVEEIPKELKGVIESGDIYSRSSEIADFLTIIQIILFLVTTVADIIAIIGAII